MSFIEQANIGTGSAQVTFTEKKQQRYLENHYAKLEPTTQKILQKLKKRLDQIDEQVTVERLESSRNKIHHRISRHADQRIKIDNKPDTIFSEGRHAAKMSQRIEKIKDRLQAEIKQHNNSDQNLKGRITVNYD